MAENEVFRVGVTPDWGERTDEMAGPPLRKVLGSLPDLEYEVMPDTGGAAKPEVAGRYDALLVFGYAFPRESFEGVERLKCIARWGVGFDRIDVPACTEADVLLAITPNAVRRPVAEGIIALIFALAKNIRNYDRRVREGRWRENLERVNVSLEGRTLGSVGFGNIAGEMFRIARGAGFGRLLAYDPFVPPQRAAESGVELADLPTVLKESDFVAVNTPLNDKTRGLIGARELALMKSSAYLINTARGPIVDEAALIDALKNRRIKGAGLDVFEQEPPPKDNPLFELDNVILAPHAISFTEEGVRDLGEEACTAIRDVYEGKAPAHLANPEVLERPGMQAKLASRRKS